VSRDDLEKASREELIEHALKLQAELGWFKKQLFGPRSERRVVEVSSDQLWLGDLAKKAVESTAPARKIREHTRRSKAKAPDGDESGLRFDENVPVETIEIEDAGIESIPDDQRVVVSEKVTHRLAQRPGAYVVLRYVRKTIKRKDTGELLTPPAVPSVLERSYADVSLLAGLLIDKFLYYLPLHRQHQRLQAAGITLSRSSLSNWVHRTIALIEPVYDAQVESILESKVLAMDETPTKAGLIKGRPGKPGKMKTGYFWPIFGDRNEVAFPFAPSRGKAHIEAILRGFSGTLLSDGYDAYARFAARRAAIVHALCWSHARRPFVKAENVEPELVKTALDLIGQLYRIEEEIRAAELEGERKREVRDEKSRPIVERFFAWLDELLCERALLPSNPFTKAANYSLDRRSGLEIFLGDPNVPLDTNHLERTLRPIPMGRKNWMFCWTEIGAERVGQIQSLLSTCVLQQIDPYVYLIDVLQRIAEHPQSRVRELIPREWKTRFADQPMRSVLHWLPR